MKRIALLTISIFFCTVLNAQDTIIKFNGDKICSKIIDVSTTEVKYKKFDFQNGPTYIENKSNIQLIKYSNGSEEKTAAQQSGNSLKPTETNTDNSSVPLNINNKIATDGKGYWYQGNWMNERKMQNLLITSKDQQITSLVGRARKYRKLHYIGYTVLPLALMGNIFLNSLEDPETRSVVADIPGAVLFFSGAIAVSVTAIHFRSIHKASNKEAVKLYNAKY